MHKKDNIKSINTLEKGWKFGIEFINLGSIFAWEDLWPLLVGFILLQGAKLSLASCGLGLVLPAFQLEAKNPVSIGL